MFRVTINIKGGKRINVYLEGGYCVETYVDGIGWVLDDWDTDTNCDEIIVKAGNLLNSVAAKELV
jgi:hypothetical protein